MKNLFILLAIMLFSLSACEKNVEPEEPEIVEIKAERIYLDCFSSDDTNFPFEKGFPQNTGGIQDTGIGCRVNSAEDFKKLRNRNGSECQYSGTIDFSKYTLIGKEIYFPSAPIAPVYPKITKNTKKKLYTFLIEYGEAGPGQTGSGTVLWFLIPKVDAYSNFEFLAKYIGNGYTYDSTQIHSNTKLWLSTTEYGEAKTVFKKDEPVFANYAFKNYTGNPLDWFQIITGEFAEFEISGNGLFYYSYDYVKGNTRNGILKADEEIRRSWKIDKDLPAGEWNVQGYPIRDFKLIRFPHPPKKVKFTVEE